MSATLKIAIETLSKRRVIQPRLNLAALLEPPKRLRHADDVNSEPREARQWALEDIAV
jgi:hypothetical protein